MNNKGLTVVELVVSFVLSVVVALFLIEIVLILKDTYVSVGARSVLMNKQAVVSNHMNELFKDKAIISSERCGTNCVKFTFDDMVEETIYVDRTAKTITIGNYANEFPETAIFGEMEMEVSYFDDISQGNKNSILKLTIPIQDKLVENYKFDINVIHQYDNRKQGEFLYMKIKNMVPAENDEVVSENGRLINVGEYGIRYQGKNPNNYIYFNCSDYNNQSKETCEMWRIIGIVDGKVKIVKNESIGQMAWDNPDGDNNTQDGNSNWSDSTLQIHLNGEYYENIHGQNMISPSIWYLKGYDNSDITKYEAYDLERTTGTIFYEPGNIEKNIGLIYPSDWGFAANCATTSLEYYYTACGESNWLSEYSRTITPYSEEQVFAINAVMHTMLTGLGFPHASYDQVDIHPTLYLEKKVLLIYGDGSEQSPYQISMNLNS